MKDFMPIVAQDYQTGEIRMVGVGNEESTAISDKTWKLTFWSRTKWRLWTKGETSWDFLEIQDKQDTVCMSQNQQLQQSIIYRVKQVVWETGMTCHKGTPTCFWDGVFDIKNRLALKRLDYAKMNGKVLVITQATPSNGIVWVRMLDEPNVKYLLRNLTERSSDRWDLSIDCDNDTLLIRVPMGIAVVW
jgi:phosphoribosyl-AMP cyclohydrolase